MNRKQSDYLMTIIMLMTLAIIISASIVKIHSVVHGPGVIITKDNAQLISLTKGGTIDGIYVTEGAAVKRNDLLAKVVNLDLQKEYERAKAQKDFLSKDISELSSILDLGESEGTISKQGLNLLSNKEVAANIELIASQTKAKFLKTLSLESEVRGLDEKLLGKNEEKSLLAEEINILSPLVKKGISSYTNLLNKKQAYVRLKSETHDIDSNIRLKKNEIGMVSNEIKAIDNELRLSLSKQLSKNQQELDVLNSTLNVLNQQLDEGKVRSPIDGVIYKINKSASTYGGVIQAADLLFEIKPLLDTMLAEVKINPKYRDQLFIGEKVKVDISSIVQKKGKIYDAVIDKISPDSYEEQNGGKTQRYYKVIISFKVNTEDANWLKPGMTVDANVVTGRHSIMEYLISPLIKGVGTALSEPINTHKSAIKI
ncbi:TPA: HlyD family efflux transporter periplasmic adaptor subunit [Yersinia enterocolitica]|nr:HlyD family efflux transporter periplasmic adaptor subunit [Yersinia enterocolitica]HEN3479249.1 HlyD family efflux transporter periplasmic adaptor subunit [Yersinia enterocolitica]